MGKILLSLCIIICIWFSVTPYPLQARSLYWQDMEVEARLDEQGVLHVREQQTMVFTGAWNGGERRFSVLQGQSLRFRGLWRMGEDGKWIPLTRGDLAQVDHYNWAGKNLLRWRSRLPSDPTFNTTPITYRLDYSLGGVLQKHDGTYRLSHDFCFPDRDGVIQRFVLDFTLDPVWQGTEPVPRHHEQSNIPPGQGVVLTAFLHYSGTNPQQIQTRQPTASVSRQQRPGDQAGKLFDLGSSPAWLRGVLFLVAWGFFLVRTARFFAHERKLNRFAPLVPVSSIDHSWLKKHLFSLQMGH